MPVCSLAQGDQNVQVALSTSSLDIYVAPGESIPPLGTIIFKQIKHEIPGIFGSEN